MPIVNLDSWRGQQLASALEEAPADVLPPAEEQVAPEPTAVPTPKSPESPASTPTSTPVPSVNGAMAIDCDATAERLQSSCRYEAGAEFAIENLNLTFGVLVAADGSGFLGSVTLNGQPAPDGTSIEALVDGIVCGTTTTSDGADFQEGCGTNGDEVLFRSSGLIAEERGQFLGMIAQDLI